jgi:hypothetical protein
MEKIIINKKTNKFIILNENNELISEYQYMDKEERNIFITSNKNILDNFTLYYGDLYDIDYINLDIIIKMLLTDVYFDINKKLYQMGNGIFYYQDNNIIKISYYIIDYLNGTKYNYQVKTLCLLCFVLIKTHYNWNVNNIDILDRFTTNFLNI